MKEKKNGIEGGWPWARPVSEAAPPRQHKVSRGPRRAHLHHPLAWQWMLGRGHEYATKRFILPSLLLLLAEKPSHGYALQGKLVEMGVVEEKVPLPAIYRILNHAESAGLVHSEVVIEEGRGPARKVYRLTDVGMEALSSWYEQMEKIGRIADEFRKRYETAKSSSE